MSRFSPDTWQDAVQLPLAMAQFRGNVYVETIAPDIRPVAFIVLVVVAVGVALVRARGANKRQASTVLPQVEFVSTRSAWALIAGALVALAAWIWTSANGRYGLLALTLTPLAALAALRLISSSKRWLTAVLGVMLGVQGLYLFTADVDFSWLGGTGYQWRETYADRLPAQVIMPWRTDADRQPVLVVTASPMTGMSTLYQVFGPNARYMGLFHLNRYASTSPDYAKARRMVEAAQQVYFSEAVPVIFNLDIYDDAVQEASNLATIVSKERYSDSSVQNMIRKMSIRIPDADRNRLLRFGLAIEKGMFCTVLPARMGMRLIICPLVKVPVAAESRDASLPEEPLQILHALEKKCPRLFGEQGLPESDGDGGVTTYANDMKYRIGVQKNLDIYIKHLARIESHLILEGEQVKLLDSFSCNSLITPGYQYW
jgi:hypothetical protein